METVFLVAAATEPPVGVVGHINPPRGRKSRAADGMFWANRSKTFLGPLGSGVAAGVHLVNGRNGAVLARTILPAFDSASRRTGLLRHDSLPQGSAMVIAPTNSIHTFFMRFAIDIAFVSRSGEVVSVRRDLVPWRMAFAWRAYAVIEMPSGTLALTGTCAGDPLILRAA
jgi:uncharacterized membrane protein (UPF0127 family)